MLETSSPPIVESLRRRLPAPRVVTDPAVTERYSHDEAAWAPFDGPAAVVRPEGVEQVADVVRCCAELGVPLVPRGAGTGLSGGANATSGCVVLSFEAMDAVLEINAAEQIAVVQPGVVNDQLRRQCAEQGLWYPPDPASAAWSTIGGNVATNAGGLCCVKYGVTRDYVLGLQAVVGQGDVVRLGRRTAKGVAGYDLCGLLVGSEGTLGVVTEITLRLRALRTGPEHTVVGYFDSLSRAGDAVAAVTASGMVPSALELMDRYSLQAVDEWKGMGLAAEAEVVLLGRSDAAGDAGLAEAALLQRCFEQAGASWAAHSQDQQEADALFEARKLAYPALERLAPPITEDVCVPRPAVAEMLRQIQLISKRNDTRIANIAHAGDGNLHPLIVVAGGDDAAHNRARVAFDEIVSAAIALGGTVTGEHGVGLLKRDGAATELGETVTAMQRAVKQALDPAGIFNPGKVF